MALQFTTSRSTGYVYETEFVFTKTNLPSYNITTWNLGDGTVIYNSSTDQIKHIYQYPGVYKISLSAWSQTGAFEFLDQYIEVDYKCRDAMLITQLPEEWSIIGQKTLQPFVVSLTSAKIDSPISIVLQSVGSDSVPANILFDKWKFLVPTWYFTDAATNQVIDGPVLLSTVPIYGEDNKQIAVSATASFYYIDHNPTITEIRTCPIIITATLSTQNFSYPTESLIYPYYSYSNNETVKASTLWHVFDVVPTELKITENFLQNVYSTKWTNIPIPTMVTCRFDPNSLSAYNFGPGISATDVFRYPQTNELGKKYPLVLSLSGANPRQYTAENHSFVNSYSHITSSLSSNLYFQKLGKDDTLESGYVFTTITPLTTFNTTTIVAQTTAASQQTALSSTFLFPTSYPLNIKAYISHPFESNINAIELNTATSDCTYVNYFTERGMLAEGQISTIPVPLQQTTNTDNLTLSGFSGVYAVSYNPAKRYLYAADSDLNKIHFYQDKQLIRTLELSTAVQSIYNLTTNQLTAIPISPSSISIDKNHNVWIGLFDSSLSLKYNSELTELLGYAAPVSDLQALLNQVDPESEESYKSPSVVEVDQDNNLWVAYAHPLSGSLVKYNSTGTAKLAELLLTNEQPVDIVITKENDIWVAARKSNRLWNFSSNGVTKHILDCLAPSYIAMDKQNNLWVLHGYNLISKIITNTLQETPSVTTWKVLNNPLFELRQIRTTYTTLQNYPISEINEALGGNEIWGGLAIDVLNRVWAIDSETNKAIVFSVSEPANAKTVSVIPTADTNFYIRNNSTGFVENISTNLVRSAQAVGDWTGNKWYQKFGGNYQDTKISGTSTKFKVLDIDKDGPQLAKINEDFDCAGYFESLALPELLRDNKNLFDSFLGALVGAGGIQNEEIGRVFYEKIANFTLNHSDIDTAEIPQLVSLLKQLKINASTYGIDFPAEIQRLLNIFSVSLFHLRGIERLDPDFENNIGSLLTETAYVTAGQYLYVRDRRYSTYQLVQVSPLSSVTQGWLYAYPLSTIEIDGLRGKQTLTQVLSTTAETIFENYYFFEYNPFQKAGYHSNLIDWNNPYTTITYQTSSANEYYKDDGIIELYFNNLLTKRLFL